jgi:hypothetical protein
MIWELNENKAPLISKENIEGNKQILGEILENPKPLIENKIKDIEQFVQEKNSKDLKLENDFLFAEYDWKIKNQNNKKQDHLSKGQNYLISGIDKKISELRLEIKKLLADNQSSKTIRWELCGPVNVAFLTPSIDVSEGSQKEYENIEELKKEIELKGMETVMEYEKEHGREPKDVSAETIRGYDIESKSTGEKRCIEVKSNQIFMSSGIPMKIL